MAFVCSFKDDEVLGTMKNTQDSAKKSIKSSDKTVKTQPMRIDLNVEIPDKSTVFCQGSAGLKRAVQAIYRDADARFLVAVEVQGRTFCNGGDQVETRSINMMRMRQSVVPSPLQDQICSIDMQQCRWRLITRRIAA